MDSKTLQLSPADWARLKDVLHGALSLDPAQRPAFINTSDLAPELKAEVASLLSNADAVDDFLSVPAGAFAHGLLDGHLNEHNRVGERLGVYELISVLGRGGMGTVFLAERCDEKFEQRVAIKVLKRELNTADLREAFTREIQIQSKLVHPNIATIIDAGTTDDDLPYIVMEYIEGVPIDQYCVNAGLSLNEVLKLFNKVCNAVAFAHRNLIIHRDLKPGNIVVNGNGVPKLLDFGISELVSTDGIEENVRGSVHGLTPNYSSPEQRTGKIVGTPADIYSLGIILFKLLTGKLPVDPSKNGSSNGASPSSGPPETFPSTELPDDLDSIIRKATANDPDKRYQTADQLSTDIWRFIDGEPVQARPNTVGYRFKKFVLRRRLAFSAFVIIVVSLVGGTAVALWQARVARSQAAAAKTEQAKSEKISKFMFRVLSYANPNWYAEGAKSKGQARVLDVMYELGDKIDEEFANEPDVAAELHYRFSEALLSHPEGKERGRSHILRALELRKSFYGEWHELVAKDMAYVYWSKAEKSEDDIANFERAIVMLRSTNPANRNLPFMLETYGHHMFDDTKPERAEAFFRHASDRAGLGRYELADKYLVEMLDLLRLHYKEDENPIIFTKCALAMTKAKIGQFDGAQEYFNVCKAAIDAMPVKRENWVERLKIAESLLQNRPLQ